MAKMNLEQLRKLREDKKRDLSRREVEGKEIHVIVGMGTCGIAAGAKQPSTPSRLRSTRRDSALK